MNDEMCANKSEAFPEKRYEPKHLQKRNPWGRIKETMITILIVVLCLATVRGMMHVQELKDKCKALQAICVMQQDTINYLQGSSKQPIMETTIIESLTEINEYVFITAGKAPEEGLPEEEPTPGQG